MRTTDFLIIGGGIVGITIARELAIRHPGARTTLIEKEPEFGRHASGRNSGVLHAGFYYSADSLKARFTRDGNRALHEWCEEKALRINPCGKLVVATTPEEQAGLDELKKRGDRNGVELEWMDEATAREVEPLARVQERALWSPATSAVDSAEVVRSLLENAQAHGVDTIPATAFTGIGKRGGEVQTTSGTFHAGMIINTAGLYADRIAHAFGLGRNYQILPFKGLYRYADHGVPQPRVHIYPVPDLANPFLGVHFTITVGGRAKIGPTAIPAFWREHYQGLGGFSLRDAVGIVGQEARLFLADSFGFRRLAFTEMRKYNRNVLVRDAARLAQGTEKMGFTKIGRPGIRAQLVDVHKRELVMDFLVERNERSIHILNAVSPAFTCALPFARHILDEAGL